MKSLTASGRSSGNNIAASIRKYQIGLYFPDMYWFAAFLFLSGCIQSAIPAFGGVIHEKNISDHTPLTPAASAVNNYSDDHIIVRLTQYHVKPAFQAKFREALSNYVFSSLKAKGNIMSEAYYEERDATVLWIVERWSDESTLEKNDHGEAAKQITALTKDGLETPVNILLVEDLEPLSKDAYRRTPDTGDQPLTIMLTVDAKEGTENDFRSRYHIAMPAFRDEPGVVTYQLSRYSADKTKFITYEKFRSQKAFEAHLKHPAVKPILDYLKTSIKSPPFEKGLHRLIELAPLYRKN